MKKISILGAGWLGEPLALTLKEEGYGVKLSTASDNRLETLETRWDSVFQLKVSSGKVEGDVVNFLNSDILIINITPNKAELEKEQFASFIFLLEQSSIQKVLFVSSTSVYRKENKIVGEDQGLEDIAHHLYRSEQLFQNNSSFETTVVRFAGLVGGTRHPGRFFSKSGRISNSLAPVNLIQQEDCILVLSAIIRQEVWGEVFNACANEHPLKGEYYSNAAKSIGLEVPILDGDVAETSFCIVDNRKVKERLGLDFRPLLG